MIRSTLTKLAGASLIALGLAVPAHANTFSVLAGAEAAPMTAEDMDATQGKFVGDLIAQELAFTAQINQMAAQGVTNWYNGLQNWRAQTGYLGPINTGVNAMTISQANQDASNFFYNSYMPSLQFNGLVNDSIHHSNINTIHGVTDWINPNTGGVIWGAPMTWNFNQVGFNPIFPGQHAHFGLF